MVSVEGAVAARAVEDETDQQNRIESTYRPTNITSRTHERAGRRACRQSRMHLPTIYRPSVNHLSITPWSTKVRRHQCKKTISQTAKLPSIGSCMSSATSGAKMP
eukprot:gnl/MRDRNA2_/MRDRNA2_249716_c0_seq1.p1 gnl/MRDRNA2_/MRDRNA2_249716_c0~~gnl/MRDRNA2_/MRDRNA2_249716_c0_seq1.p1  ORF type:complete len:105 (+),score=5.81 gnl/MRDRNA2_/MRDRNA2_249716_c0_seq1:33-347(+)